MREKSAKTRKVWLKEGTFLVARNHQGCAELRSSLPGRLCRSRVLLKHVLEALRQASVVLENRGATPPHCVHKGPFTFAHGTSEQPVTASILYIESPLTCSLKWPALIVRRSALCKSQELPALRRAHCSPDSFFTNKQLPRAAYPSTYRTRQHSCRAFSVSQRPQVTMPSSYRQSNRDSSNANLVDSEDDNTPHHRRPVGKTSAVKVGSSTRRKKTLIEELGGQQVITTTESTSYGSGTAVRPIQIKRTIEGDDLASQMKHIIGGSSVPPSKSELIHTLRKGPC